MTAPAHRPPRMSVAFVTPLAHPSRRCGGLGWKLVCGLLPWLVAASTSVAAQADPGYVGVVFARKTVELAAETSGTLTDVHVRLGDEVEEHQVLLTLEAPGLDQEIRGAAASVRAARAEAGKSEAELEEAGRLLDRRQNTSEVFTQEEIESLAARKAVAEANLEMARSRIAAREATLRELQERKEALQIRAPFPGSVAACYVDPGTFVTPGRQLMRLLSTGDLWVRFAVPAKESSWLVLGHPLRVISQDDRPVVLAAEIRQIAPEVDSTTEMIFVEALLTEAGSAVRNLPAGSVVRVKPVVR